MAPAAPGWLVRQVFALYNAAGLTRRDDRIMFNRWVVWDPAIGSTDDMTTPQIEGVVVVLRGWQQHGQRELRRRARQAVDEITETMARWDARP